jgi:hypothetical protein
VNGTTRWQRGDFGLTFQVETNDLIAKLTTGN